MAVTGSFTPQQAINTARLRHPALTALVLDDPELVEDINQAIRVMMIAATKIKPECLMQQTADLAVTGADGSILDLEWPEGEPVGIPRAIEAVQSAVRVRVLMRTNIEHREALARELVDDGRPGGIWLRDATNNRWALKEIINWTGVTAVAAYGAFFPALVTSGTLNVELLLPFVLFGPLTEYLALELGHRSDLGGEWFQAQQATAQAALEQALTEFML
jgi:hypothetical protein